MENKMNSNKEIINDMELIEQQKENIQPIQSGRSVKNLVSLFKPNLVLNNNNTSSSSSTSFNSIPTLNPIQLIQERKKIHLNFQHQIQILQDALEFKSIENDQDQLLANQLIQDPLDIYLQYIRWTIESYPSGGSTAESNLIPLLEQVTRKFMKYERYKQDMRYLKCWLFYLDQVNTTSYTGVNQLKDNKNRNKIPNPNSSKLILNFLIHHRIGTKFNLLYLEYFKLFLPIEKLKLNLEDRIKLEQVIKFGLTQVSNDDSSSCQEELMGLLNQIENIKNEIREEVKVEQSLKVQDQLKIKETMINSKHKNLKKKKMKVFEDIGVEVDHEQVNNDSNNNLINEQDCIGPNERIDTEQELALNPASSLISKWDHLGTVASNRKQNTLDPSTWKGQRLPMKLGQSSRTLLNSGSSSSLPMMTVTTGRTSKIKVFEDHHHDNSEVEGNDLIQSKETLTAQDELLKTEVEHERHISDEESGFDLVDRLLRSEIQAQINTIHRLEPNDDDQDAYLVLKWNPLQFHDL